MEIYLVKEFCENDDCIVGAYKKEDDAISHCTNKGKVLRKDYIKFSFLTYFKTFEVKKGCHIHQYSISKLQVK